MEQEREQRSLGRVSNYSFLKKKEMHTRRILLIIFLLIYLEFYVLLYRDRYTLKDDHLDQYLELEIPTFRLYEMRMDDLMETLMVFHKM